MNEEKTFSGQRLQKVIAASGYCSRRQAEEHIKMGKVTVNGKKVTELGTKVDPLKDQIEVSQELIKPLNRKQHETILLNKPRNCLVTRRDVRGRPTIYDLLPEDTILLPVGRLDFDSEGLLILTTDRGLIHRLTHPSFEVNRTYHVKIQGQLSVEMIQKIEDGLNINLGTDEEPDLQKTGKANCQVLKSNPHNCWVEITLREGKNREVRRIFDVMGRPVLRLKRVAFADLFLEDLESGKTRALTESERNDLIHS